MLSSQLDIRICVSLVSISFVHRNQITVLRDPWNVYTIPKYPLLEPVVRSHRYQILLTGIGNLAVINRSLTCHSASTSFLEDEIFDSAETFPFRMAAFRNLPR